MSNKNTPNSNESLNKGNSGPESSDVTNITSDTLGKVIVTIGEGNNIHASTDVAERYQNLVNALQASGKGFTPDIIESYAVDFVEADIRNDDFYNFLLETYKTDFPTIAEVELPMKSRIKVLRTIFNIETVIDGRIEDPYNTDNGQFIDFLINTSDEQLMSIATLIPTSFREDSYPNLSSVIDEFSKNPEKNSLRYLSVISLLLKLEIIGDINTEEILIELSYDQMLDLKYLQAFLKDKYGDDDGEKLNDNKEYFDEASSIN